MVYGTAFISGVKKFGWFTADKYLEKKKTARHVIAPRRFRYWVNGKSFSWF
jgi:hypothetical protein